MLCNKVRSCWCWPGRGRVCVLDPGVASPLRPLPVSKMCVKWVLIVILFTRNYHTAQLIYHFLYTTQRQAAASQTPGSSQAVKKIMKLLLLRCQVLTLQILFVVRYVLTSWILLNFISCSKDYLDRHLLFISHSNRIMNSPMSPELTQSECSARCVSSLLGRAVVMTQLSI